MESHDNAILLEVEEALTADTALQQSTVDPKKAERDHAGTIGSLLRIIGSLVLIAAGVAFLVQRWVDMDDTLRYLSFLGFTGVLTACGFVCGVRIKEDKGARTFLALAASMVTINFAQLGGLLYSSFLDPFISIPQYFRWTAPSLEIALLTTAGAVALLTPITAISMRVLARGKGLLLSGAFLGLNALLLVPSRDASVVAALFIAGLVAALEVDRIVSKETSGRTWEGRIARILLFVPPTLLLGRSLFLYSATQSLYGIALLGAAYLMFSILPRHVSKPMGQASEVISYFVGSAGWFLLAGAIHSGLGLASNLMIPLLAMPIAASLALLSFRVHSDGEFERFLAAMVITGSAAFELFAFNGIVSSFYCVVVGLVATVAGYAGERKAFFLSGVGCLGMGLLVQIKYAVRFYSMSPWISLAILGIAIVIASSYAERYYPAILKRVRGFGSELKEWR